MLTNKNPSASSLISLLALLIFLPILVLGVTQMVNIIKSKAIGTQVSKITVDASAPLEIISTDFIRAFSQGGEESTDMLAPVLQSIKGLKPKLIRIDHIYDHFAVVSKSGNTIAFDFSRLDEIVKSILATGATPVLSLSYMPEAIAKDGSIINPPNSWSDWSFVVQKTIEHYSGKNAMQIQGVYYEVWNEPDLAQFGAWKLTGDKNYLTLYKHTALGAANAKNVHQYYLGGPATTGLYENWIKTLANSGYRLDFVSWHSYLTDPERFETDQRNVAKWLIGYPQYALIPRLITEFGFTGAKDSRYSTKFAAAHTAAVFRKIATGSPTYLFSFQLKDGPDSTQATNGWGIIGHESLGAKKKPRYFLYEFLEKLRGTRLLLQGEGTWTTGLATIRDTTIRIMLVNFNASQNTTETFPLLIKGLENGSYGYKISYFLGPTTTTTNYQVKDGTLVNPITLTNYAVALVEITKQ